MENPFYDLVIGNLKGAIEAGDPDLEWKPNTEECHAVTRSQKVRKPLKPLKVAEAKVFRIGKEELRHLQESDATLGKIRGWVDSGKGVNPRRSCTEEFYRKDGIMYRRCEMKVRNQFVHNIQLILPEQLREGVMEVAHDSILGGHMGSQKTLERVKSNFYWPGLTAEVNRFCQSCDICQRTVPKGYTGKVALGKMPIIDVPFHRVAFDLIGPLPVSDRGHRWILTLIDYATRYPEAVPLKTIETTEVAETLISIFSRVGVPKEMLTDGGTQFTSELMREVARLMSIRHFTTTPYHAMCNGLVENFNGTLKKMLKRVSDEKPKDWDRYIPALLFACVPQASLKFSPFKLLYGRTVRGPLQILIEIWTGEIEGEKLKTTYQYVLELRERLEETCQIAHEELRKAQISQRQYYNKKS